MPAYQTSPFSQRVALLPGIPSYSFGSYNDRTTPSKFQISQVALTSNVATVTVLLEEGLIPVTGALISIQGTQTASGAFNVTNVALTGVTIDSTAGTGTLTFALTHANVAATADSGTALVPQPIVTEAAASGNKGQQFAIQSQAGGNRQHGLSWFTDITGGPSAVSIVLQIADVDIDAEYTTVDTSISTTGETRFVANVTANFARILTTTITGGTSPGIAAGIILS